MRHGLIRYLLVGLAFFGSAQAKSGDGEAEARLALAAGARSFFDGNPRAARIELLNAIKADPENSLPHALQGRIYLALGDGVAAEAELQWAVRNGMDVPRLSHLLAHAYLLQGDPDRALEAAGRHAGSRTAKAYAHRMAARAAIVLGQNDRAANELDAALAIAPRSSLLWSDIGRFRLLTGNVGGAVEAAQKASILNPINIEALLLMGQLVRGQYGLLAAIPWFEKALKIDPGSMEAMSQFAATLGEAGQYTVMLALTRKMLTIDPDNAQAFYLQAVMAARAGNDGLARSLVYRIRGKMDTVPAMLLLQSVLEMKDGNAEQAIARLEDLSRSQPANLTVRRLLGLALWQGGDAHAAIAALEPLTRRADADSYTLTLIGRAYEDIEDRASAAFSLDRATQTRRGEPTVFQLPGARADKLDNPDNADVAIPRIAGMVTDGELASALIAAERLRDHNLGTPAAHVLVGDVLTLLDRPADAANAYQAAANLQFSEPTAMRFVAALQRSGQSAAALGVLDLFLSQNPRSVPALRLAADHLMATGQWGRAIGVLEGLRLRLGDRDATILANLGWAWFSEGRTEKALVFAGAAYALAPTNPAAAKGYGLILLRSGKDKARGIALIKKAANTRPVI